MSTAGGQPEQGHQARGDQDDVDLVGSLGRDEIERDDEYRQREHRSQHGAVANSVVGSGYRQAGE